MGEVDPEVREGLATYLEAVGEGGFHAIRDLGERRAKQAELVAAALSRNPPDPGVVSTDRTIPRDDADGGPIPVRVYEPAGREGDLPALVYFHGGGLIMGSIDGAELPARAIVAAVGCALVSVGYRLAPEHPYPAALDDAYRALEWTVEEATALGLDPARIGLYGGSGGGCLVAGTALLARDRGGPPVVFQMLPYPMLDDRDRPAANRAIPDFGLWDRAANAEAWRWVFGERAGDDSVPAYAAPARATDLAGLPPTYIDVGQLDPFLDEDVEFAIGLAHAGVPTDLRVYPGVVHGSELIAPQSRVAKRILEDRFDALRRALLR